MKDTLYFLKPNFFTETKGPFYCPGCAELAGLLEWFPQLKSTLDLRYLDYPRPRKELVEILGAENQSCPVLLVHEPPAGPWDNLAIQAANTHFFVEGARSIARYLSAVHHIPLPY